ncbi:MAG: 30S ribosomal protein S7 [bacterium]|nr:30S ribosomal protein S7 [bacterium]
MRGKQAPKRIIAADSKLNSLAVAKFINFVMERGKKTVAQKIVYSALDIVTDKTGKQPLEAFELAIRNVAPTVEVKAKRVGGSNYQVPMEVRGDRRQGLAFRWILAAARGKKGKPMAEKLATEFMAAMNNEGDAVKKKLDVHRMAEANRAFAHFA